jgi:CHAT domain-containing protein
MSKGSEFMSELYMDKTLFLYRQLFHPVEPYLQNVNTIFISPAGLLHQINFNSIRTPQETLLADQYNIIRCITTRQTVTRDSLVQSGGDCVMFGSISYDMDTTRVHAIQPSGQYTAVGFAEVVGFTASIPLSSGQVWRTLDGSEKEVKAIHALLLQAGISTYLLTGQDATEEAFTELYRSKERTSSPFILHISTHGYFFPDSRHQDDRELIFKNAEHPLIRSGLILAGGNYAWQYGHAYTPGGEDGILTAHEISLTDLSHTELVVLSACETGLGDMEGNEGVYGLQRAFKIAGVKNLIMSLWKVPDAATAELMVSFYKHWLEEKMTIRQALHAAQEDLKNQGLEPYYWAAWVLIE